MPPPTDAWRPAPGRRSAGRIDDWTAELAERLGVADAPIDVAQLLDVARDVAHAVERPAVPVTMYLLGYAAAQRGGTAHAAGTACADTTALAGAWAAPEHDDT